MTKYGSGCNAESTHIYGTHKSVIWLFCFKDSIYPIKNQPKNIDYVKVVCR